LDENFICYINNYIFPELLLASQEGLFSMELDISLGSDLPQNTPHISYKHQSAYV